jgi:hypothetical protein
MKINKQCIQILHKSGFSNATARMALTSRLSVHGLVKFKLFCVLQGILGVKKVLPTTR